MDYCISIVNDLSDFIKANNHQVFKNYILPARQIDSKLNILCWGLTVLLRLIYQTIIQIHNFGDKFLLCYFEFLYFKSYNCP